MSLLRPAARRSISTLAILSLLGFSSGFAHAQTATGGGNWIAKSPSSNPGARYYTSSAYDAATGTVVYFGGQDSIGSVYNETWTWDGTNWTKKSPSSVPPARYGAMMAYDAATGNVVLFGGANVSGAPFSDTWTWNGTNWTSITPATSPSARFLGNMVFDTAAGNVVLFGGKTNSSTAVNDTWTWDGTNWTSLAPATSPSARSGAAMAYDFATSTVVLFGGLSSSNFSNSETWTWDGSSWTQQSPGTSPGARYFTTAAYDAATATVLMFGGTGAGGVQGDTWAWNGTNWTQQSVLNSPTARSRATASYDATTNTVVLYGGTNGASSALSDTQTYVTGPFYTPTTNVGTPAAQTPVYFTITSTGTLGTTQVLSQGAPGLDFTLGTGSTCTGSAVGACVVNVAFAPATAGQRLGAVNLIDSNNNVLATAFVSGTGNAPLAALSPGLISTVAGNGGDGYNATDDNGTTAATTAELSRTEAVALDGSGNLYIADYDNQRIRKVTAATGTISTVAGTGVGGYNASQDTGTTQATAAEINAPSGLAVDGAGNLYIADQQNQRIREVNAATQTISTVAGNGQSGYTTSQDSGTVPATSATFELPAGIAVDAADNLYIADLLDNRIRKVTASTGFISTVAGNGNYGYNPSDDNGSTAATAASLYYPEAVAVDATGNLYIADYYNNRIRKVTASTGFISTVAGNGNTNYQSSDDNGTTLATTVAISNPTGVTVDAAGDLYIAEQGGNRIRKVNAKTGYITSLAGNGNQSYDSSTDTGTSTATTAPLSHPVAVAVDGAGNLFIADQLNYRVRKVSVTGDLVFLTATAAGGPDTADGTQAINLNNIGNEPLVLSNQPSPNSNFTLANPNGNGCTPTGTVAAGDDCVIAATFAPQTGASGLLVSNVTTTDNSLYSTAAIQNVPLTGSTSAGAITLQMAPATTTAGALSVTMNFIIGWGAPPDTGAYAVTVNGSSTGVGTITCLQKPSHANCSFAYTNAAVLDLPAQYPTTVTVAADTNDGYAQQSASALLTVQSAVVDTPHRVIVSIPTPTFRAPTSSGSPVIRILATPVAAEPSIVFSGGQLPLATETLSAPAFSTETTPSTTPDNCPAARTEVTSKDTATKGCPK